MRLGSEVLSADLYAILEVPETASPERIKRSWRRLAMQSHPDRGTGDREEAEGRMARINVAASILLDPARRAAYDRHRRSLRGEPWPAAVEPSSLEWEPAPPRPDRRSWIPTSAELGALVSRIRPWSGRALLAIAETTHAWPPKRHAAALAICVVMALSLIAHAKPRSLPFLHAKPPALGVAYPPGT